MGVLYIHDTWERPWLDWDLFTAVIGMQSHWMIWSTTEEMTIFSSFNSTWIVARYYVLLLIPILNSFPFSYVLSFMSKCNKFKLHKHQRRHNILLEWGWMVNMHHQGREIFILGMRGNTSTLTSMLSNLTYHFLYTYTKGTLLEKRTSPNISLNIGICKLLVYSTICFLHANWQSFSVKS